MIHNEGELDRILRIVLGTFLILFSYTASITVVKLFLAGIAVLSIFSGFVGYSNFYRKFGLNTSSRKKRAR